MAHTGKLIPVILILLLAQSLLTAGGGQLGFSASFCGGLPSGKGLWDWTDLEDRGTLYWNWGGGAGISGRQFLGEKVLIEEGANLVYIQADQQLGSTRYTYTQYSLEIPLLVKTRLPFKNPSYLGVGPDLVFLPFEGTMNSLSSRPDRFFMLALNAGMDVLMRSTSASDLFFSFHFVHPLTSPRYGWIEESSGSVRINRVELTASWFFNLGDGKR